MKKGYAKSSMKIFGPLLLCDYIKYSILGKIGLPTFFFLQVTEKVYCSKYCHTTISHQCKLLIDLNIMSHVTDNFYVLNFAIAKNLTFYTPLLVNESVQYAVLAAISLFGFSENAVSLPIYYPSKMKIHIWKQTTVCSFIFLSFYLHF